MALRVAFLGAGNIASAHVKAIRALGDRVDLVGVCDLNQATAEEFCRTWAVPKVFKDSDTMIGEAKPDVIHVLLPASAHVQAAKGCLDRGCHIFVEKPFCLTSEECRTVLRAAEANGRQVGVNHNLTYMPVILKLIDAIRNRDLGKVQHVTVMYNLPAPALDAGVHGLWMFSKPEYVLLELGPHPLSVIHRLLGAAQSGSTVVDGKRILNHGGVFYDTWQTSLVCERGTAQMVLSLGGQFLSTWVHVLGQDGEAMADLRRNTIRFSGNSPFARTGTMRDGLNAGKSLIGQSVSNYIAQTKGAFGLGPAYDLQAISVNASVQDFYRALEAKRPPRMDGQAGADVVRACEIVIDSAFDFVAKGAEKVATT